MSYKREDIFRSSARYYTEFRKPYPELLFTRIRDHYRLSGQGALLDIGCGTGQIALPLSQYFDRVVGVDISENMVEHARQNAIIAGVNNAEFLAMPGEEIGSLTEQFSLVTFGSALHWRDIPKTLTASRTLLTADGGIVILDMRSIWGGSTDWEQAVVRVVQKWMGQSRRAGSGSFNEPGISYEQALFEAGFSVLENDEVEANYTVDIPFIIGHLYTTSYCNREQLGDELAEFEHDLTHSLLEIDAGGNFQWSPGADYIFARKAP